MGLENGVIDAPIYVVLVIMAIATSLAAGPLIKLVLPPQAGGGRRDEQRVGDY